MSENKPLPRPLMLSVAVIQSLILFVLYKTHELKIWPSESPVISFPLWTLGLLIPVFLLLSIGQGNDRKFMQLLSLFAIILSAIAAYTGWQAEPYGEFRFSNLTVIYSLSTSIACFKALMYMQQRASSATMNYQVLFTFSWRNFLILAFSGLFVLGFGLLLMLWAKLFSVIGVDFFQSLFSEQWFLFPALGFAFGLGIIVFRELMNVIDSVATLLQGLIKILLPMAVSLAVLFVFALPFTGVSVLWETGFGTTLLLCLTALVLFFVNAVYQDSSGVAPYSPFLHRWVYRSLCVLPVICCLSFYGLLLRWEQYGWTVQRSWGFLVWLVLTLFSLGYVWGIVTRRSDWPVVLAKVNTLMGLTILVLILMTNSPALNFREISMNSQLARVENGEIQLIDLDYVYINHYLARSGYLALEKLKGENEGLEEKIQRKISNPVDHMMRAEKVDYDKFWREASYRPEGLELPIDVVRMVEYNTPVFLSTTRAGTASEGVFIALDLNGDGNDEYVLIRLFDRGDGRQEIFHASFYYQENNVWKAGLLNYSGGRQNFFRSIGSHQRVGVEKNNTIDADVGGDIKTGKIERQKPDFDNLKIGEVVFRPSF
ncbi:MAG: hypothetical protein ACI92E_000727 [Oceanicoccus sp.]|jgi:hypothetical protein